MRHQAVQQSTELAGTPSANGPVCLRSTAAVLHPCRCEIPDKQHTTRRETAWTLQLLPKTLLLLLPEQLPPSTA